VANNQQVSQLTNSIQGQLEVGNRDMPFRMDNCGRKLIKATLSISLGGQKSRRSIASRRNFAVAYAAISRGR